MKMQNELQAGADGIVREVRASEGENVEGGAELVILDPVGA
jgi:biotin carboxyl carrier protein